jgi:hypothetical protein
LEKNSERAIPLEGNGPFAVSGRNSRHGGTLAGGGSEEINLPCCKGSAQEAGNRQSLLEFNGESKCDSKHRPILFGRPRIKRLSAMQRGRDLPAMRFLKA